MYQIIDMASSLRDKALLLLLFMSGVRVNVIEHLTYGDVKNQLDKDVITLKITSRLDYKLRGHNMPFYFTFIGHEGTETLRRYCQLEHKNNTSDTPLFRTKRGKPVSTVWVWSVVKMCVERAGFDPKTISTHTLRKAFRKVVRRAPLDDDDREQLMGHVIQGSRQSYFDKNDVELIMEAYEKCDFAREIPQSNHVKMRNEIEELRQENLTLHQRLDMIESLLKKYMKESSG